MRNRLFYLIFTLILISTNLKAQIEELIKSYVDSTEFFVNNGRRLILHSILEEDYKKAKNVYQYLDEKTQDSEFKAFSYFESIYISMLIHDWQQWTELTKNYNKYSKIKTHQNSHQIISQLDAEIVAKNDLILFSIESSNMDDEGKGVAKILLYFLKNKRSDEEYNKMLGDFKKTYKTSRYNVFIINSLPRRVPRYAWGVSFGSSSLYLTDKLSENFTSSPLVSLSMDVNIGKVFSSIYMNAGVLKLNNPFTAVADDFIWDFQNGEYFNYSEGGILLGYFFVRNKRFHVSPYVKLAVSSLQSNWYDSIDEGNELDLLNSFTYGPGLHTELKLFEFNTRRLYGSRLKNYVSLKLESGYNFIHKFEYEELKGNSAYLGMAVVWGVGSF